MKIIQNSLFALSRFYTFVKNKSIVLITCSACIAELYDTMRNMKRLKEMAYYESECVVKRVDSEGCIMLRQINSNDLVPGDVMIVPDGNKMPCDAILLEGDCVVNEALLTGESLPAIKSPLPYDPVKEVGEFSIENKEHVSFYFLMFL